MCQSQIILFSRPPGKYFNSLRKYRLESFTGGAKFTQWWKLALTLFTTSLWTYMNPHGGPYGPDSVFYFWPPLNWIFLVFILLAENDPWVYLGKVKKYQHSILTIKGTKMEICISLGHMAPPEVNRVNTRASSVVKISRIPFWCDTEKRKSKKDK